MQKKYHSPFKRIAVSKEGGETIQHIQNEFDAFWKKINKVADKCPEKFHAMKAMQESCQWLSRACALKYHSDNDESKPNQETRILNTKKPYQEDFQGAIDSYQEGKRIQNTPRVFVKRKKI